MNITLRRAVVPNADSLSGAEDIASQRCLIDLDTRI